jgi:predicted outer membrane protein
LEVIMTTGFLRTALFGLILGLVAVPLATTAVSTLQETTASAASPSIAEQPARDAPAGNLSPGERMFVENAYVRGLVAVGAGQVAFEASSIHEVRLLAAHILTQRVGIDEKLVALAKTKGMDALPDQLDASGRQSLEALQEASGDDDFELRYCGLVVATYLREIKAFQGQAENAADPDLRVLAAEVVAQLKQHLAIALVIQRALANALNEGPAVVTVSHPSESRRPAIGA